MKEQVILRVVSKVTIPYILVFGLYIITHGELGPGGGFQGGVVLASAFILYGLVFGLEELEGMIPHRITDVLAGLGVLMYAGVGMVGILAGYRFLDYAPLTLTGADSADSWGMTLVEYGVGITVASVMMTVFREIAQSAPVEP